MWQAGEEAGGAAGGGETMEKPSLFVWSLLSKKISGERSFLEDLNKVKTCEWGG